ncbi:MAG: DNA-binding protein HU-beta [Actinomycetota bacterium]|nr:DNA-binding protein HU-beta [Actinomycetota bacterium]
MNRSELASAVTTATGLEPRQAADAVEATLDVIMSEVAAGRRVSLTGFASFERTWRSSRYGRNPGTGERIFIPAAQVVRVRVGKTFKQAVKDGRLGWSRFAGMGPQAYEQPKAVCAFCGAELIGSKRFCAECGRAA